MVSGELPISRTVTFCAALDVPTICGSAKRTVLTIAAAGALVGAIFMTNPSDTVHLVHGEFDSGAIGCRALKTGKVGGSPSPPLKLVLRPAAKTSPLESTPILIGKFWRFNRPASIRDENTNAGLVGLTSATNRFVLPRWDWIGFINGRFTAPPP